MNKYNFDFVCSQTDPQSDWAEQRTVMDTITQYGGIVDKFERETDAAGCANFQFSAPDDERASKIIREATSYEESDFDIVPFKVD